MSSSTTVMIIMGLTVELLNLQVFGFCHLLFGGGLTLAKAHEKLIFFPTGICFSMSLCLAYGKALRCAAPA